MEINPERSNANYTGPHYTAIIRFFFNAYYTHMLANRMIDSRRWKIIRRFRIVQLRWIVRGSPHEHNIQYFWCNICDTIFEIHTSNKFNTEILKNKREKKIRKGEVNCLWIVQSIQSAIYTYLSNATLFNTYVRTCVYYYWEKLLLQCTHICCSLKNI